jgi:hypothetical protein
MTKLPTKSSPPSGAHVLTDQQESYATHYSTFGDPAAAYRHAYNVTTTRRASIQQQAYRVLHNPKVAARITTLRNQSAADALASRESLIADLEAMVNVDTNELMQLRVVPCSGCWPDAHAWALAAAAALDAGHEAPPKDEPNPTCASCAGAGRNVGHLTNTADLSLPARRLFKGLEFFPDGGVKRVLMHDAAQLRIELHKLKGMHVERHESKSFNVNYNLNAPTSPQAPMTAEDAIAKLRTIGVLAIDAAPVPDDATVVSEQ